MNDPGFTDDFRGCGPLFAAVGLGDSWYNLAAQGFATYLVEVPGPDPEHTDGWAFLDRRQAEAVADAVADVEFSSYQGPCGWPERTPVVPRSSGKRLTRTHRSWPPKPEAGQ